MNPKSSTMNPEPLTSSSPKGRPGGVFSLPGLPIVQPVAPPSDAEVAEVMDQQRLMQHPLSSHLEACEITPDKQLPKRDFLFTMFGKPCFARGELVAVTGKSKSGKTYFCSR